MYRYVVCKTVGSYPARTMYVLINERHPSHPIRRFSTIGELANSLKETVMGSAGNLEWQAIKNDIPGDVLWKPETTTPDQVLECTRLDFSELRELAKLLR